MLVTGNNVLEQEEISSNSNSENEFKELDNEIEKVVRGEASYEDEAIEKRDLNATSDTSQNSNKNNQKIINKKGNNPKEENKVSKMKNTKTSNISINDFKSLNNKEKSDINNMINYDKNMLNNSNNFQKKYENNPSELRNNFSNNINLLNNTKKNNSSFNPNQFNINYNNNFSNNIINNNNLNEFIPINNNISTNGINYTVNINNIKEYDFLNNLCKHINLNPLNNNVYNNNFISSLANVLYSANLNQTNLPNNICNNLVINNQMINPINFNLHFSNNNNMDTMNPNNNQLFLRNNLNNNDFNNNINKCLSHYLQINNPNNKNPNIINIIRYNNENIFNKLGNSLNNNYNFMDIFVNNVVNNNPNHNLNNINVNTNLNNNFDNAINDNNINQINNNNIDYKPEKKGKNSNKRKIFYPLPESEKEKNIINLMDIFQCKDLRTTLMIKNIPNKYTISSFLDEINEFFKNTYDIFYLPIDYINKCNLGFAFINFVEPFHIILFYEMFRGKKWKKFNSDKICELLFAKFQGRKQLISHFEKGKVLSFESEDKRPLILPAPKILPKINFPLYYLDLFQKFHPYVYYKIRNINSNKNNSVLKVFSINGNFHKK